MQNKKKKAEAADPDQEQKRIFGDPVYGAEEDIYSQAKKETLKSDDTSSFEKGLDVPGSELDDADERIGEEDEENNYYSLGGDDHNDLEEEKE